MEEITIQRGSKVGIHYIVYSVPTFGPFCINVLNEVLGILHCITAKPAFMFGLEVWFVRGKNNKEFATHQVNIPEVNCWVYTDVKRSYSHSTVANVVKNFMIHGTQGRAHVERMEFSWLPKEAVRYRPR